MTMAAGSVSMGGIPTGPIRPPFAHPEFQGSVPAHWMDRGSGYLRGKPLHNADIRDGYNGIARQGFGPFAIDAGYRVYEESQRRTKQFPDADHRVAPWGDHPQELRWKPSRRKLEDHEFEWRVGPSTRHGGLLAHVAEPALLSKRPPFVDKQNALPNIYDGEVDRAKQKAFQKSMLKRHHKAVAEDRWERTQVLNLEDWERSHVNRGFGAGTSGGATLGKDATGSRRPQRSASEGGLQSMRQQG